MLRFCCLGSGSEGNATVVEAGDGLATTRVLLDNGFNGRAAFLTFGYAFEGNWRLELEGGYRDNDLEKRNFVPAFGGDLREYSGMINVRKDIPLSKRWIFDIGAGVLYLDAKPGKKANLYAGLSASHLTQPDDKFGATGEARFPMRYTFHGGVRIAINEQFSLTPNLLYLQQGTATEKMVGAYGQYKATGDVSVLIGANYRFEDAVAPFFGFTYRNMMLGASYDINTSDLGKLVNGANSFEISLSIIGRKSTKTPEVEFVCPRL